MSTRDLTLNDDSCPIDVDMAKGRRRLGPRADTLYTIKVSQTVLTGESGVESVEETNFHLADHGPRPCRCRRPSTPRVEYQIEEIDAGGIAATIIDPNSSS